MKEKEKVSEICHTIHQWFNGIKKHSFPFDKQDIPKNGIYILFEKGELAHTKNRIVRIGTHTGNDQLRSRLSQHFLKENKDRSIFRKNIGRALLNKGKDVYLKTWDINFKIKINQEKYGYLWDIQKEKEIEKRVTEYIRDNILFVTFQIEDKKKRHELESKIISTVSLCDECTPSPNWLGLFSPVEKIRRSGLWLVNELWKTPLSEDDLIELKNVSERGKLGKG